LVHDPGDDLMPLVQYVLQGQTLQHETLFALASVQQDRRVLPLFLSEYLVVKLPVS